MFFANEFVLVYSCLELLIVSIQAEQILEVEFGLRHNNLVNFRNQFDFGLQLFINSLLLQFNLVQDQSMVCVELELEVVQLVLIIFQDLLQLEMLILQNLKLFFRLDYLELVQHFLNILQTDFSRQSASCPPIVCDCLHLFHIT